MHIWRLGSFPIEQEPSLLSVEQRLAAWFMNHMFHCRIIGFSHRFDMQPVIDRITARQRAMTPVYALATQLLPSLRALVAGDSTLPHPADVIDQLDDRAYAAFVSCCGEASVTDLIDDPDAASAAAWLALGQVVEEKVWTRPFLIDQRAFYTVIAEQELRAATYLLVTWEPPTANLDEIRDSLSYAIGRPVVRVDELRPILSGAVRVDERRARIVPVDPGTSWMTVLRSYATPIAYDATLLHAILNGDHDVAIAVDIQPVPHSRAQSMVEIQMSAATMAMRTSNAIDPQTAQRAADAERTMIALPTSSLHQVQVAVLVQGSDAEDLAREAASVRDRLGMALRMEAVAGSQAELLKLFSTIPATKIDAAWCRSDTLAHGVGCMLGMIGFHRSPSTEGWLFGTDGFRRSPVFIDPFSGGHAGHMVYLGVTGYGKTFAMNLLTIRAAVMAGHRVIWVDAEKNGARLERALGAGITRHILSQTRTINPLDLVFRPDDGPEWLMSQVKHGVAQLTMIMGHSRSDGEKTMIIPREFTPDEQGYLERALLLCYGDIDPDAPPSAMPILADLITALETIDAEEMAGGGDEDEDDDDDPREARALARTLRKMLYGSRWRTDTQTALGKSFNGITTVDWTFDQGVTFFDLSEIVATRGDPTLYYAQAIGAIFRFMRDPNRDTRRKTLIVIDEFGLASRIRSTSEMAVTISKVARKYGMALVTADQLPNLYLDTSDGQQILGNTRVKVIFHLEEPEARRLAAAIPQLTEAHIQYITAPGKGRCVMVYDDIAVPVRVDATEYEALMLSGS